jgi:putative polyhydroxyalkanoic acid system protein
MSKSLVLTIPHRLGKDEAIRRLKSGLGSVGTSFGHVLSVQEESWTGDHLQFRVSALGQVATGTIVVTEADVRLEVILPWLLAQLGEKLQPILRKQGSLMLEKK